MEKNFKDIFTISLGDWAVLGVVLVILKTHSVIDWSWWLVTAPFWFPFLMTFLILLFLVILAIIEIRHERKQNEINRSN